MRTLVLGLVLGLLLGTAAQAGAQYLQDSIWFRLDHQGQTAYVAGVADTLESVTNLADRAGADQTIDRVRIATRCTGQIPPNRLADLGNRAIERAPRFAPPSTAIIVRLVACGSRPYGWGPEQPLLNYGQPPYYIGRDPGDGKR